MKGKHVVSHVQFSTILFSFHKAELVWSPYGDDIYVDKLSWNSSPAVLKPPASSNKVTAEAVIPDDAHAWMINLCTGTATDDSLVVTSMYQDLTLFAFAVHVERKETGEEN